MRGWVILRSKCSATDRVAHLSGSLASRSRIPGSARLERASDNQRRTYSTRASGGLLVEADHVSSRIAEPRSDLERVRADRLHDFAAMGDNRVDSRRHAVNHDVKEEPGLCRGRAPAHLAGRIVKGSASPPRLPIQPQRDPIVRGCRGICEPAERARLLEDWVWRAYLPYPTLTGWANFCRAYLPNPYGLG